MKTMWEARDRDEIASRLATLDAGRKAEWGRMTATQMIRHLSKAVRMANGELVCRTKRTPLAWPGVKHLVILVFPFPRNVPTAPELIAEEGGDGEWGEEMEALRSGLARFVARAPDESPPSHPIFGRLSRRMWGALAYKHVDHHLRQFGA